MWKKQCGHTKDPGTYCRDCHVEEMVKSGATRREVIDALLNQMRDYNSRIAEINRFVSQLRKECSHDNVEKSKSWELDQIIDDNRRYREIRERRITCLDCGHGWNEQRYAHSDEPWPYDLGERG